MKRKKQDRGKATHGSCRRLVTRRAQWATGGASTTDTGAYRPQDKAGMQVLWVDHCINVAYTRGSLAEHRNVITFCPVNGLFCAGVLEAALDNTAVVSNSCGAFHATGGFVCSEFGGSDEANSSLAAALGTMEVSFLPVFCPATYQYEASRPAAVGSHEAGNGGAYCCRI